MPKPKRAVIRDDGVRYESTSAAAKAVAGDQTNISRACRTGRKAYGHLWGYADEGSFARYARLLAVRDSMDEPYAQASESTMLRSCPFCGGKPYVQTFDSEDFAESRVVCSSCHVSTSREYSGGRTTWEPTGEGETVYVLGFGEPLTVKGFTDDGSVLMSFHDENSLGYKPSKLTHEQPDTWERLEHDAEKTVCEYFGANYGCANCPLESARCAEEVKKDIIRRARKLAKKESR